MEFLNELCLTRMSSAWGQGQFAVILYDSNSEHFNQEILEHVFQTCHILLIPQSS